MTETNSASTVRHSSHQARNRTTTTTTTTMLTPSLSSQPHRKRPPPINAALEAAFAIFDTGGATSGRRGGALQGEERWLGSMPQRQMEALGREGTENTVTATATATTTAPLGRCDPSSSSQLCASGKIAIVSSGQPQEDAIECRKELEETPLQSHGHHQYERRSRHRSKRQSASVDEVSRRSTARHVVASLDEAQHDDQPLTGPSDARPVPIPRVASLRPDAARRTRSTSGFITAIPGRQYVDYSLDRNWDMGAPFWTGDVFTAGMALDSTDERTQEWAKKHGLPSSGGDLAKGESDELRSVWHVEGGRSEGCNTPAVRKASPGQ